MRITPLGRGKMNMGSGWKVSQFGGMSNLPPGVSQSEIDRHFGEPAWADAGLYEIMESVDPKELDKEMRESIQENAEVELTPEQVDELVSMEYYREVDADMDWDHIRITFRLVKPTNIIGAPKQFVVWVRNNMAGD